MLGTIRIEQEKDRPIGRATKIFVDDKDISRFVRSATFHWAADAVNSVTLECVGNIELPEELQAHIVATTPEFIIPVEDMIKPTKIGDEYRTYGTWRNAPRSNTEVHVGRLEKESPE